MAATAIPRFSGFIRFIGGIIVFPSILGLVVAVLILIATISTAGSVGAGAKTDAEAAGAAIGASIGFGFAVFVGAVSLVAGLVGWLLLMKRKVLKCERCGFVLDRG